MLFFRNSFYILILFIVACDSGTDKNFKKTCIEVEILKDGKYVIADSCFTAPTRDSLDRLLADFKMRQAQYEEYSTKLLFVMVDTLKKKPDEYEYALVQSDAGIINPDVILTSDPLIVKEKTDKFPKGSIIFHKLKMGESLSSETELIFKNNIRINYIRESNVKVKK